MKRRSLQEEGRTSRTAFRSGEDTLLAGRDARGSRLVPGEEACRHSDVGRRPHSGQSEFFTTPNTPIEKASGPAYLQSSFGALMVRTPSVFIRRDLLTRGRTLLHQQCWLWGQDVRYPEGNLLLRHGFDRKRPPAEITASTQYLLQLDERLIVRLWGFGLAYGTREDQIYINRYEFRPRVLCNDADRWEPPAGDLPSSADTIALEAAVRWIGRYEGRIEQDQGRRYRSTLLLQWKRRSKCGQSLEECWRRLAEDLASERQKNSFLPTTRSDKKDIYSYRLQSSSLGS